MADDISKKVLIDVQVADDDANAAFQALKSNIDALNNSTVLVSKATETYKNDVAALNVELAKGKVEQQNIKTAIDKARLSQIEANNAQKQAKKDMVAASGSYDEAQKKLTALGRSIKSTEGGFKSQDAAIKAQIADYKKLNAELKAFDKEMGNHQRNVGGYEEALSGLNGILSRLIPGFSQFQSILQGAAKGFNAMGKSAADATESAESTQGAFNWLSVSASALGIAIAGVATATASVLYYFSQFRDKQQEVEQFFAGVSNQFANFGKNIVDIFKGKTLNPFKGFVDSFNEGVDVKTAMQQIKNLNEVNDQQIQKMQAQADQYRAFAKDVGKSTQERIGYLKQAQKQEDDILQQQQDNAQQNIDAAINLADIHKKLTESERNALVQGDAYSIARANDFAQAGKITESGYEALQGAYERQTTAMNTANMKLIRQQNDMDKIGKKGTQQAEKEAELLEKIRQQTEEANSERLASITRTLGFQREAFAKELDDLDEHYRQLIFKQRKFIEDQQKIVDSLTATPREKAAAKNAISAAQSAIDQFNKEHYAAQESALTEHGKKMLAETQKAANSLKQAQIASISDENERQKQANQLAYTERTEALNTEANQIAENEARLATEIKTATGKKLQILKDELAHQKQLYAINRDEATQATEDYQRKELDREKKHLIDMKLLDDQLSINKAKNKKGFFGDGDNPFNRDLENAEIQQTQDNTTKQLQESGLDEDKNKDGSAFSDEQLKQKQVIQEAGEKAKTDITKKYAKERISAEIDAAKQIADESIQIAQQAIQRNYENAIISMDKQKTHDLQNQALTSTQRYAIEEQYRVKEGQAKVKQFKQEQEIGIAKALIAGAIAEVTALELPPPLDVAKIALIAAETVLQVGVIASEKAPAYATGGIHYDSDGKGGILPGYSRVDNMNARLRSGEGIVVSEAMRDPWARQVVSAINQTYGGRSFDSTTPVSWSVPHFASGGLYQPYTPTGDNGLRPQINISSNSRIHPDDINGIANAVANIKMPPIDIKDVNYQQGLLSQATDRLNY